MAIHSRMILFSLLALLPATAATAAEPAAAPAASAASASPDSPAPVESPQVKIRADGDPADAYAIGIGDVIEIAVWKNPDLTVTVPVRPDGRVSVPLLGDVQAAGMTPLALKQTLTEGFRQYVTAPGVSVVIKEINSQKVFVTGEVAKPGAYDLRPHTKLMQALALAGGLTPYAKGRVIVLRDRQGKDRRFEMDLSGIIKGRRPEDNITLQAGDTLIFP